MTAARSHKIIMVGAATGLALGAFSQLGLLPLSGVMSLVGAGGGWGAGVQDVDFSSFQQGEIVKALYEGDFETLDANPLATLVYLDGLNEEVAGPGVVMYVDRDILDVVDPSLSTAISRKLMTSRGAQEQMMNSGMNALMGIFGAIAETRRSGGSMQDEVAAVNSAMVGDGTGVTLMELKQQGVADGRKLARVFETNRPAFEQIYANMSTYVR